MGVGEVARRVCEGDGVGGSFCGGAPGFVACPPVWSGRRRRLTEADVETGDPMALVVLRFGPWKLGYLGIKRLCQVRLYGVGRLRCFYGCI